MGPDKTLLLHVSIRAPSSHRQALAGGARIMPQVFSPIRTKELIAWDFDAYKPRPESFLHGKPVKAREIVFQRRLDHSSSALCEEETRLLRDTLDAQLSREDLQAEMRGLDWSLGVVDLRLLLAFQRRLSFDSTLPA